MVACTAAVGLGVEWLDGALSVSTGVAIVLSYGGIGGLIGGVGVWAAADRGLPTYALVSAGARPQTLLRVALLRVALLGTVVGVAAAALSVALAAAPGSEAARPWFWRRIQTPLGTALWAAHASLVEETFFRLFLIPFTVALAARVRPRRYRLRVRHGRAVIHGGDGTPRRRWAGGVATLFGAGAAPVPPGSLWTALIVSSALFGLAHPFNPLAASAVALLLAGAYLAGGIEAAILAHLVADLLVFTLYF